MDVSGNIGAILTQKSDEIFSVSPETTVHDAVAMMDEKNVGALLVMKDDKLVGMLSERDYTRKVMLRGRKSADTNVSEIMSTNLTVTHPNEGVEECLRVMTDKRFRHLPVLDGEKVVGVISIGDLVKHVISCQSATIAHLENYISGGHYSCQTVFPPTIVRTARPFSFQPSNGELRDADLNLSILTVHSKSGSIRVMSAGAPTDKVPASSPNSFAGSSVYISIKRTMSIIRCLCTRRSRNKPSSVSNPMMPNGAASNSTSFSKSACGA